MAKSLVTGNGKPGFLRKVFTSLFGIKTAIDHTTGTAFDTELNRKNSINFDRGNIERRYTHRSSQAKRRKLERRRGHK